MTDDDERIRELEKLLAELTTQVKLLSQTVSNMSDYETRIRSLEMDTANNRMVVAGVKWLAVSICGSALTVLTAAMMGTFL